MQDLLPDLQVDVRHDAGDAVLVLAGDLVGPAVARARTGLAAALEDGQDLVVDVSGVREIDSIGLGLLVRARWRAVEGGASCRIRGATPPLLRAFESSRIAELLTFEA